MQNIIKLRKKTEKLLLSYEPTVPEVLEANGKLYGYTGCPTCKIGKRV